MSRISRRGGADASRKWKSTLRLEQLEARCLLSGTGVSSTSLAPDYFVKPAASGSSSAYTPAQIRTAYGFNSASFGSTAANGSGQTIAIIDAYNDPNITSDLTAFDKAYGIAAPPSLRVVSQTGSSTLPGSDSTDGWEVETALDVEWAHAIAPGANILLVEATNASDTNLFAAVNYARNQSGVSVISMSWGSDDNLANQQQDQSLSAADLVTPAGHQGITFVAATGDHGVPGFPATSPNVLAVGGTDLYLNSNNTISSETAWTPQNSGGSVWSGGGGPSQEFPGRDTPDVSYDAGVSFNVYDTFGESGWIGVGGTSAGAPQWAALVAIANQGRAIKGESSLDGASQTIPAIYQASAADFNDITVDSTQTESAGPGYDMATGRGSPVANLLITDLSGWAGSTQTVNAPAAPGNFTAEATSSTQVALSWSASTGATGYSVYSQVNGQSVLVGTYSATTTSATISNLSAGTTYTYDVAATNSAGSTATGWVQVTTPAAATLAAPQNVSAAALSSTSASLSWSASTGATGYTVYMLNGGQAKSLGQVSASTHSVTITGLAAGSTDQFEVAAFNATSTAASGWVSVSLPASAVVAAPQKVTAVATSSTTGTLSWSASAGATGYEIYWWNGRQAVLLANVAASTTSISIRGLAAGSTNDFAVVAYNATSSAASAWTALTTPAAASRASQQATLLSDLAFELYGSSNGTVPPNRNFFG